MKPTMGLNGGCGSERRYAAVSSSIVPPTSPIRMMPEVAGSERRNSRASEEAHTRWREEAEA